MRSACSLVHTKCRLFNLIDLKDNGTKALPLKALEAINSVDRRVANVQAAFVRLQSILQISFPAQQFQIATFSPTPPSSP